MIKNILLKLHILFSTLFYIGYFKKIPGTVGTIFSFLFYWFFIDFSGLRLILFLILLIIFGIFICGLTEKFFNKKDDSRIVFDELIGSFIALAFIPKSFTFYFISFCLFRLFDIFKPFGIKNLQKIKGGLGIVIDDVVAGMVANLITNGIIFFISFLFSFFVISKV